MKNNKGFTLVEILSVIVLISLLLGIGIPGISRISKNMKERSYKTKVNLIEQAAVLWGQDNKTRLQVSDDCNINGKTYSCYKISINELIDSDYLDADSDEVGVETDPTTGKPYNNYEYLNPKDNDNISGKCVYVYKKNNRVYSYYSDKNEDCDKKLITSIPTTSTTTSTTSTTPAIINHAPTCEYIGQTYFLDSLEYYNDVVYSSDIWSFREYDYKGNVKINDEDDDKTRIFQCDLEIEGKPNTKLDCMNMDINAYYYNDEVYKLTIGVTDDLYDGFCYSYIETAEQKIYKYDYYVPETYDCVCSSDGGWHSYEVGSDTYDDLMNNYGGDCSCR